MINWKAGVRIAYDPLEHAILLSKKDRNGVTTKYIRSQEDLTRVQWFLKYVWNARFKWDGEKIVEVKD